MCGREGGVFVLWSAGMAARPFSPQRISDIFLIATQPEIWCFWCAGGGLLKEEICELKPCFWERELLSLLPAETPIMVFLRLLLLFLISFCSSQSKIIDSTFLIKYGIALYIAEVRWNTFTGEFLVIEPEIFWTKHLRFNFQGDLFSWGVCWKTNGDWTFFSLGFQHLLAPQLNC